MSRSVHGFNPPSVRRSLLAAALAAAVLSGLAATSCRHQPTSTSAGPDGPSSDGEHARRHARKLGEYVARRSASPQIVRPYGSLSVVPVEGVRETVPCRTDADENTRHSDDGPDSRITGCFVLSTPGAFRNADYYYLGHSNPYLLVSGQDSGSAPPEIMGATIDETGRFRATRRRSPSWPNVTGDDRPVRDCRIALSNRSRTAAQPGDTPHRMMAVCTFGRTGPGVLTALPIKRGTGLQDARVLHHSGTGPPVRLTELHRLGDRDFALLFRMRRGLLWRVDGRGETVWERELGKYHGCSGGQFDLLVRPDNSLVVAGANCKTWSDPNNPKKTKHRRWPELNAFEADGTPLWTRRGKANEHRFFAVDHLPGGDLIALGSTRVPQPDRFATRYSQDGDTRRWKKDLSLPAFIESKGRPEIHEMVTTEEGFVVLGTARPPEGRRGEAGDRTTWLRKYDASAQPQWTRRLGSGPDTSFTGLESRPDGGFVLLGSVAGHAAWVMSDEHGHVTSTSNQR